MNQNHQRPVGNKPDFDPQRELAWLRELIGSPLWGELSPLQQQRWLHQLDLLSRQHS